MQRTIRKLTIVCTVIIFAGLPHLARGETGVQAWIQGYNGPGNGDDVAYAVAIDTNNNVIVTGYCTNGASGYDYATIKYSSAGTPLWTNRFTGLGNRSDLAYALAVDGNNDVVVAGHSTLSSGFVSYATIKYSSAGIPLWTNLYAGRSGISDSGGAVAVDTDNNVIVSGGEAGLSSYTYVTIKYSSAGAPLWTNRYKGPTTYNEAQALAVDGNNDIVVTGWSGDSAASSAEAYATIKYSSAGTPLWTNRYIAPPFLYNFVSAIAVDSSNSVIVTGVAGITNSVPHNYDYATIKYSSAGVAQWTNYYNGPANGDDLAQALRVDSNNDVVVTGYSPNGSNQDYLTIKYSSDGVPLWTNRYNGPVNANDFARALALDTNNNVFVSGYSWNGSSWDIATMKYSSAGALLWTARSPGATRLSDLSLGVATDRSGNPVVTGYTTNGGSGYDYATVKYIGVPEPRMSPLLQPDGTLQLEVDDVLQPGRLVIEACTDLAGWLPIFTNTTPTNVLFYTDPDAGNYPGRFYRAYQSP